jgi:hypothetical protein
VLGVLIGGFAVDSLATASVLWSGGAAPISTVLPLVRRRSFDAG